MSGVRKIVKYTLKTKISNVCLAILWIPGVKRLIILGEISLFCQNFLTIILSKISAISLESVFRKSNSMFYDLYATQRKPLL